jgi:hypothetical protein
MNNYVDYIPSLYYSARATNTTELATKKKKSEPALAQLAIRLVPQKWWQSNYNILRNGLPQSLEEILVYLEGQENLKQISIPPKPTDNPNHGGGSRKKGKNTVISVQRIMGQQTPITPVSVVGTILTEVGSIKRVSPMETRKHTITFPSSSRLSRIRSVILN